MTTRSVGGVNVRTMRRTLGIIAALMAVFGLLASPVSASVKHPTPAEKAFLKQMHRQNIFPGMSDGSRLKIGHAFCDLARDVGYADAYLEFDDPENTPKTSANLFLLTAIADKTLCPDVGKSLTK